MHGAIDQKRVSIHVEPSKLAVTDLPAVRKGSKHRLIGCLCDPRIDAQGHDNIAIDEKLLRICSEAFPIPCQWDQELLDYVLWMAPGAAEVWKALRFGPSEVWMERIPGTSPTATAS